VNVVRVAVWIARVSEYPRHLACGELICLLDETVSAGDARGVTICRALREVDGDLDPCFLRGLNEVHGRFDEAGLHGPDKVGGVDSFHRSADGVDLEQVAGSTTAAPREEADVRDMRLGIQDNARPRQVLLGRVSAKGVSRDRLGRGRPTKLDRLFRSKLAAFGSMFPQSRADAARARFCKAEPADCPQGHTAEDINTSHGDRVRKG
jgi:hypothetical protein